MVDVVCVEQPQASWEERSMKHYAGLDVSVKETSICIVDEADRICREMNTSRGSRTNASGVASFIGCTRAQMPVPPWSRNVPRPLSAEPPAPVTRKTLMRILCRSSRSAIAFDPPLYRVSSKTRRGQIQALN